MSTISIDAIMACMTQYAQATKEEAEAREKYDGYSWDYFGGHYLDAARDARYECEKALREYIALEVKNQIEQLHANR